MDVLRHLDRSNCRECGAPTCMAFAAMAVQGQKKASDCTHLDGAVAAELDARLGRGLESARQSQDEWARELVGILSGVDLAEAAARVGGTVRGERIAVRCLGKTFELDGQGSMYSECHVNMWVQLPLIHYVASSKGRDVVGEWVPFRDLASAKDWVRFFEHRCEGQIRRIADLDPDLFLDTLDLFSAREVAAGTTEITASADHVYVMYPFPKVPLLVAYWRAEGEFESKLVLLFDRSAEDNLGAEPIFRLGTGIVEMLRKIMRRHGHEPP